MERKPVTEYGREDPVYEIGRELDLALVVVELGETSKEAEARSERDYWSGNTSSGAVERAWKKSEVPS